MRNSQPRVRLQQSASALLKNHVHSWEEKNIYNLVHNFLHSKLVRNTAHVSHLTTPVFSLKLKVTSFPCGHCLKMLAKLAIITKMNIATLVTFKITFWTQQ